MPLYRLTMLFATNRAQFEQFFTDNESTIQLLIQRLYSLPLPYSTQCSVNVDRYTASLLHATMLEALTPVRTTGDGNCLWNAISVSVVVRSTRLVYVY